MSAVPGLAQAWDRAAAAWRLLRGRFSARVLRARGARVGAKSVVGLRCRVLRPWALSLGERCTLEDDVYCKIVDDSARVAIGGHVFVGRGAQFDVQRSISVGDHTVIAPGAFLVDHDHGLRADLRIDQQPCEAGAVAIGRDVWIGARAVILAGVSVGDGAVIGAGAVVTRDVPPLGVAAGVPARVIGWRKGGARC